MSTSVGLDVRAAVRAATDQLRTGAADVDERRAVAPNVTAALKQLGVFQLLAPAEAIYGDPDAITAGAFRPNGSAVEVEGGYRVTGRWPFGSGACHATWFLVGALIVRDGEPMIGPSGMPMMRELWFPAQDTEIIDTWTTTGLRGTASHDYAVEDLFVPAERSCWFMEPPVEQGPLYRMPPIAMFATFIGAVPLGIARHALDAFVALSHTKVPVLSQVVLADKPVANHMLGRAKALIESAHAYLRGQLAVCWEAVQAGASPTLADRAALWLAATHAGHASLQAIEMLYTAAGADSVYATSALDRCLRDVRTSVQHISTQELNFELAGRLASGRVDALMASPWIIDYRGEGLS